MMHSMVTSIRQELKNQSDPHTLSTGKNFFKEEVKIHGVKTALVNKIAKSFDKDVLAMGKDQVFELCDELWRSGYLEESFVACHFSFLIRANYEPDDFAVFGNWVSNYVSNWASCDTLCNHTVGTFVEMHPKYLQELKDWARSDNLWARRASAVTLIVPARKGKFLKDIFEIADILLLDSEDLVQKGYGWMLKAASKDHQAEVFAYVIKNKARMPRTALRYAIEKLPKDLRIKAMMK